MKHLIDNKTIYITFEKDEVQYMREMLEAELEEEFTEIDKYTKEVRKALKNKDSQKLHDLEGESDCIYYPYFTQEKIDKLEDTMEYAELVELLRYKFMDRLRKIENREFVENFKELIGVTIEAEKRNYLKEQYLEELAEI